MRRYCRIRDFQSAGGSRNQQPAPQFFSCSIKGTADSRLSSMCNSNQSHLPRIMRLLSSISQNCALPHEPPTPWESCITQTRAAQAAGAGLCSFANDSFTIAASIILFPLMIDVVQMTMFLLPAISGLDQVILSSRPVTTYLPLASR